MILTRSMWRAALSISTAIVRYPDDTKTERPNVHRCPRCAVFHTT